MEEIEKIEPKFQISEDLIEAALQKDFKAKDGSTPEKALERVKAKAEKTGARKVPKLNTLKNLRQWSPKPLTDEEKEATLNNLRFSAPSMAQAKDDMKFPESVRNPEIIKNCLTKDEVIYFIDRWNQYYSEYGSDLNTANDYDQMVELIMNLIDLYRIQKKKKNSEKLVTDPLVDQIVHRTHTRVQTLLASLKTRRKDRVEMNVHKEDNLVKLLLRRAKGEGDFVKETNTRLKMEEQEELESLQAKARRGHAHYE